MKMTFVQRFALLGVAASLAVPNLAVAQADVYKAKCAACHGATGAGNKAMGTKPFSDPSIQGMSDADLAAAITNGKGKMPAYKGKLTDAQISGLAAYIKTLK